MFWKTSDSCFSDNVDVVSRKSYHKIPNVRKVTVTKNIVYKRHETSETCWSLKKYTKRPIVIRRKPRAEGTSGPDAAKLAKIKDFKYILDDVFAVVTTVSMCMVESLIKGVPSFCSPYSAAKQVSRTDLSLIETPLYPDREPWFNHIAYCQFTHKEIESGVAYECLHKNK